MKIPTTLKHKPVIVSDNYEKVDGRHAYKTDIKALSLGLAQQNERGKGEISAKVWRQTDEKWSMQSEELPLHRVIDLAILICKTTQHFQDAYRYPKFYDPENTTLDRIGLQGAAMSVSVCTENPTIDEDIQLFSQALSEDGEMIGERLRVLSRLLKEIGY